MKYTSIFLFMFSIIVSASGKKMSSVDKFRILGPECLMEVFKDITGEFPHQRELCQIVSPVLYRVASKNPVKIVDSDQVRKLEITDEEYDHRREELFSLSYLKKFVFQLFQHYSVASKVRKIDCEETKAFYAVMEACCFLSPRAKEIVLQQKMSQQSYSPRRARNGKLQKRLKKLTRRSKKSR